MTKKKIVAFLTAGYPTLKDTKIFINDLITSGVDIIEVGVPFSDPIAGGLIIEKADLIALKQNITSDDIFNMLIEMKEQYNDYPFVLKSYTNTAYKYGYEKYFKRCQEANVKGVILIDLPYEEREEVENISTKYNVDIISLIAPTSKTRIEKIAKSSKYFINLVPSLSSFKSIEEFTEQVSKNINEIKKYKMIDVFVSSDVPTLGLVRLIKNFADGIIIDTGIMEVIDKYQENASSSIKLLIEDFKEKLR